MHSWNARLSPFVALCVAFCIGAHPAAAGDQGISNVSTFGIYQQIGVTFWQAEHQLQARVDPFSGNLSPYKTPLAKIDPLYQKYFWVVQSTKKYLASLDKQKQQSWTLPPVLYLGGIAAFTIGDYGNAQKYFSRLLRDYPGYQRDFYYNDRYDPDPNFAQPVKPGVTKLLFYCQIRGSGETPEKVLPSTGEMPEPRDPFTTFQQFNKTSLKVLFTQVAFAKWLANRPYRSQRRIFLNEDYGDDTPDKRRASVLPRTAKLINDGWEQLFPVALKKSGSLKMRKYLRTLTSDDSSLRDIAAPRLAEVDQLVIKSYFAQAKVLLRKHNFAATRKKYKQIIAEYPNSDASQRAEAELPKIVPVEVNYYKKEGDANFHPTKIGVPQKKAAIFYEKMYKADDSGSLADVALYYWARALSTEGKAKQTVQLLEQHLIKFPKSKIRDKAMYLLGFTYADHQIRNYKKGVPLLLQVAKEFPQSEEAPEALWNAAFVLGWNQQFREAVPLLKQLKEHYPQSPRTKFADKWITKFQETMRTGKKWP